MREYRNAMKWNAKRPARRKPPRRKPPTTVIFLVVFTVTIFVAQGYLAGWFGLTGDRAMQLANNFITDPPSDGARSSAASSSPSDPSHGAGLPVSQPGKRVSFSFCYIGGGDNCVVDGDTIWLEGVKIRIADIDTPETHDYQCPAERQLGDRATARLEEILESGPITLEAIDREEDQYGRKLRIVKVSGASVGDTLVSEGLARWYSSGRQPWC